MKSLGYILKQGDQQASFNAVGFSSKHGKFGSFLHMVVSYPQAPSANNASHVEIFVVLGIENTNQR